MSAPEIEALASPPTSTPWVPLWPLKPMAMGELAYAEYGGADISLPAGPPTTTVIVTAPAITLDGLTPIVVEIFCPCVMAAGGGWVCLALYDGGTQVALMSQQLNTVQPVASQVKLTPSAGTHTYSLRGYSVTVSPGNVTQAPPLIPSSIRISLAAPISTAPAGALLPVQYGTTLPGSPVDGQEAILVDSTTNPTYQWRFRWNAGSSSAYKWEFVGGSPFSVFEATSIGPIAGHPGYTALGPGFTVPRAGEYLLEFTGYFYGLAGSVNTHRWLQNGGDPGVWVDAQVSGTGKGNLTDNKKLTLAAGTAILNGLGVASGDLSSLDRTLTVTPARVS